MIKKRHQPKDYLTTTEASQLCHVTRFTIRNWINSGKLKSHTTAGGHSRIMKADLAKFIESYSATKKKESIFKKIAKPVTKKSYKPKKSSESSKINMGLHKGLFTSGKAVASVAKIFSKKKRRT